MIKQVIDQWYKNKGNLEIYFRETPQRDYSSYTHIVKKIIGISFIEEGANLFIIAIGYKPGGVVPILMPGMSPPWFAVNSAYPLPFGLVLTSIVIGASTLAVMLAIVMVIYKKYGTLSTKVLLADTSKQEEYDE